MDGAMMIAAVAVFNFVHPGWLLPRDDVKRPISTDEVEMNPASGNY
jgi:hypothetical protein